MERPNKIKADELARRMWEAFEQKMKEVAWAINAEGNGHLVNDSDVQCHDVLGEFSRLM